MLGPSISADKIKSVSRINKESFAEETKRQTGHKRQTSAAS
jgi:hypothetical protein